MSLIKQFVELRDKFTSMTDQNYSFINAIMSGNYTGVNACSFPYADGCFASFDPDHSTLSVEENGDGRHEVREIDLTQFDDPSDLINYTIQWRNSETPVSNILSEIGNGSQTYEILSQLSSKFSYSSKVKYSDILAIEKGCNTEVIDQLNQALFSLADEDGAITQRNFLIATRSIFDQAATTTEGGSYELDETSPFSVQTTLEIIVSGIQQAFTGIVTALAVILRGVFMVIAVVINALYQLLGKLSTNSFKINYDSVSGLVNGPLLAAEFLMDGTGGFETSLSDATMEYVPHDRSVYYAENRGIALFAWFNDDYTGVKYNAYEYPVVDPVKFLKWGLTHGPSGHEYLHVDNTSPYKVHCDLAPSLYNTIADDWIDACKYPDGYVCGQNELVQSLLCTWALRAICSRDGSENFVIDWRSANTSLIGDDEWLMCAFGYLTFLMDGSSYSAYSDFNELLLKSGKDCIYGSLGFFPSDIIDKMGHWYNDRIQSSLNNSFNVGYLNTDLNKYDVGCWTNPLGTSDKIWVPWSALAGTKFLEVTRTSSNIIKTFKGIGVDPNRVKTDFLSRNFTYEWPTALAGDINAALFVAAAIVTATAITASQLKKVIAKKQILKQTKRIGDLNKLREKYLKHPENAQLASEYTNAVYKYNKLGKIFGWGSYDGANGWHDTGASTSSFADNLTSNLSLYNSTNESLTTFGSKLDAIISLIHNPNE